jgi:hypothetical protein
VLLTLLFLNIFTKQGFYPGPVDVDNPGSKTKDWICGRSIRPVTNFKHWKCNQAPPDVHSQMHKKCVQGISRACIMLHGDGTSIWGLVIIICNLFKNKILKIMFLVYGGGGGNRGFVGDGGW